MGFDQFEQLPIDLLGSQETHILHKQKPTSTVSLSTDDIGFKA